MLEKVSNKSTPKQRSKKLTKKLITKSIAKVDSKDMFEKKDLMNRSKLENAVNDWYNWLFEANDNKLIKWYAIAYSQ